MNTLAKAAMYDQVQKNLDELVELIGIIPLPKEPTNLWHNVLAVAKEKYHRVKPVPVQEEWKPIKGEPIIIVRCLENGDPYIHDGKMAKYVSYAPASKKHLVSMGDISLYVHEVRRVEPESASAPFVTNETAQAIAAELAAASEAAAETPRDIYEVFGRKPHHEESRVEAEALDNVSMKETVKALREKIAELEENNTTRMRVIDEQAKVIRHYKHETIAWRSTNNALKERINQLELECTSRQNKLNQIRELLR